MSTAIPRSTTIPSSPIKLPDMVFSPPLKNSCFDYFAKDTGYPLPALA
jgi:hypothetical protein